MREKKFEEMVTIFANLVRYKFIDLKIQEYSKPLARFSLSLSLSHTHTHTRIHTHYLGTS